MFFPFLKGVWMPEKKKKRGFFDIFDFSEEDFLFDDSSQSSGSGYSISVTYDEHGKPVVRVKTHGNVNVSELKRDLEERYPDARIEGLEKKPLIRIVGERKEVKKEKKPEERKKSKKDEEKSLVRIIE